MLGDILLGEPERIGEFLRRRVPAGKLLDGPQTNHLAGDGKCLYARPDYW